jgi:hypothetical protein
MLSIFVSPVYRYGCQLAFIGIAKDLSFPHRYRISPWVITGKEKEDSRMTTRLLIPIITTLLVALPIIPSYAIDKGEQMLEAKLREVILENFAASQRKDIEAVKRTIHTQSPAYIASAQNLRQLFDYYDLKHELLSFHYIGLDGAYAIARGEQKTVKLKGPAFKDNVLDSIYIFREEKGQWKLWQQAVLESRFID